MTDRQTRPAPTSVPPAIGGYESVAASYASGTDLSDLRAHVDALTEDHARSTVTLTENIAGKADGAFVDDALDRITTAGLTTARALLRVHALALAGLALGLLAVVLAAVALAVPR